MTNRFEFPAGATDAPGPGGPPSGPGGVTCGLRSLPLGAASLVSADAETIWKILESSARNEIAESWQSPGRVLEPRALCRDHIAQGLTGLWSPRRMGDDITKFQMRRLKRYISLSNVPWHSANVLLTHSSTPLLHQPKANPGISAVCPPPAFQSLLGTPIPRISMH